MVDNFDIITPLLKFQDSDTFYFLQLLARRKDNPEQEKSEKVIKNYYLYSANDLDKLKTSIIEHCHKNNARAYIRLNARNAKQCALQCMKRIAELVISEQYKDVRNVYDSVAGEYHADADKKWLIDIDSNIDENVKNLESWEFITNPSLPKQKIDIVAKIPTVSGLHMIVRPFRLDMFNKEPMFKGISIHKDNPTILYFGQGYISATDAVKIS